MKRRTFLGSVSGLTAAGIAGCLDRDDNGDNSGDNGEEQENDDDDNNEDDSIASISSQSVSVECAGDNTTQTSEITGVDESDGEFVFSGREIVAPECYDYAVSAVVDEGVLTVEISLTAVDNDCDDCPKAVVFSGTALVSDMSDLIGSEVVVTT